MLAKLGREPFDSDQHLFEVKWDGFRAVAFADGGAWRLRSRNRTDFVPRYPELAFLGALEPGLVLDGEIVVFREARPDFAAMLTREQARAASKIEYLARTLPCTYVAFDVLYRDFEPLFELPLRPRIARPGSRHRTPPGTRRPWCSPRALESCSGHRAG
jgi:ATP-dependent DNA ligase